MATATCAFIRSLPLLAVALVVIVPNLAVIAAPVSVPMHPFETPLQSNINKLCSDASAYWIPELLTSTSLPFPDGPSQGQTWIGQCPSGLLALTIDADGHETFHTINSAGSPGGNAVTWMLNFDTASNSPALIPRSGEIYDYGKLFLLANGSTTWISYRNTTYSSTAVLNHEVVMYQDYSAATDTFFGATEFLGPIPDGWAPTFRARNSNGVDQIIENYCPPTYQCSYTLSLFNDGTADNLYRTTYRTNPMQIFRQTLVNGGPATTNTIIGVEPNPRSDSFMCYGSQYGPRLVVHPQGKMVFGGCEYDGLFYVDMSDSNPAATPRNIQFLSTCAGALESGGAIQVTNDRLYALCSNVKGYFNWILRVYPLKVAADGTVSVNETNYLDFSPPGCAVKKFGVTHNPIAGRPDSVWVYCQYFGQTYTNVCGFGSSSAVSTAGDTYNCTACPQNSLQTSLTASFLADTTCTPCPTGTYVASANATSCTACTAGTFLASPTSSNCTLCPSGSYQNLTAATSCVTCPLPYIVAPAGSTSIGNCSQEICETPGSNPLYCQSVSAVTSAVATTAAHPSMIVAVSLWTIIAIFL